MGDQGIAAWKLPLIVATIAIAIVAAFYVGGPGLGMAEGSLVAGIIVVMAVRNPPLAPIVPAAADDEREHLLVVVAEPLEDGTAIERIAAAALPLDPAEHDPEVRVVAPACNRFLDRWASDTGPGRERAQRNLVLSLAALAGAGVDATARIGDEDLVQTVTDELREYPATEVFLVTGANGPAAAAVEQFRSRLRAPFHQLRGARCPGTGPASRARSPMTNRSARG
ncbi:MAG TPA: hypothetical protein VFK14_00350 [Solirubrobacterales bacterium]|nr:hypothetical protein [Solirubrobacterales bacterium]